MRTAMLRATVLAGTALLATSLFAEPQFHPNSVKYSDTGVPNARGRSGSASIEARALLNQNHTTDVELTTGSFESGGAPGTISKVQIHFPDDTTRNFNDLNAGGTFTTRLGGLPPRTSLGIQTNVRGIDGDRTDVVSVDTAVKRRPDVLVAGWSVPTPALRGATTLIRLHLFERNGDTGARANCRLLVDGTEVDRAENIWIDARGRVTCTFAHEFNTAGKFRLDFVVDGVNPGDWDPANNIGWTSIDVQDPPLDFYSWDARVSEEESDEYRYTQYSWGEFYVDHEGVNQGFDFTGYIRSEIPHTDLKVNVTATTDGKPLYSGRNAGPFWGPFRSWDGYCSWSETYNPEVTVCWDQDFQYTTVDISFGASDVIYRSWGWATKRHPWAPTEPRFEWNQTFVQDTVLNRFGSNVAMDVNFEAGGVPWNAQPVIPLRAPETWQWIQPYRCFYDDFENQTICHEVNWTRITRRGSASGR